MHFFLPSALPHQVVDFAFAVHQYVPKFSGMSSSHTGGGGHRVAASHFFLHVFLSFLHAFFPDPQIALLQSLLHSANSSALWHGGGDGGGDAGSDAEGGGGVGDDEGGGGIGGDEGSGGKGEDEGSGGVGEDEGGGGVGDADCSTGGGEGDGGGGLGGGSGGGEGDNTG